MKARLPRPYPRSPQTVHSIVVKLDFYSCGSNEPSLKWGAWYLEPTPPCLSFTQSRCLHQQPHMQKPCAVIHRRSVR